MHNLTQDLERNLDLFYQASHIPFCVFDNMQKDGLRCPKLPFLDCSPKTMEKCSKLLAEKAGAHQLPVFVSSASCFFALLKLNKTLNIMFGPMSCVPITYSEFFNANKNFTSPDDLMHFYRIIQQAPHISINQLAANIALFLKLSFKEDIFVDKLLTNQIFLHKNNTYSKPDIILTSAHGDRILFYAKNELVKELHEPQTSHIVAVCLQYIENHIHSRITVEDLAQYCNLSKRTITRHFTEYFHMSAAEYILQLKLKEAAFLLINSAFSLVEISNQLSFSSQSHFSVAFKKKYNYTPQQYRNKFKTDLN